MSRGADIVISAPGVRPAKVACAWCELRVSAGKHQGSECCKECRDGGRVMRVRESMQRWKRAKEAT